MFLPMDRWSKKISKMNWCKKYQNFWLMATGFIESLEIEFILQSKLSNSSEGTVPTRSPQ